MLTTIDLTSDIPIYQQIRNAVVAGIASGDLTEGQNLPSVRRLAGDIGVNMLTVNKAYSLLKQEGYIEIDRRKGAAIAPQPDSDELWQKKWERDLLILAAQARSRNIGEEAFLALCSEAYEKAKGES